MKDPTYENLPQILVDYLDSLIKGVGANRRVRLEVAEEIGHHFVDAMGESAGDEAKEESARELIENFGDIKMLGKLIKRGKKRCRPLWQKVLLRSLYTLCGLIVFIILYGFWFFMGRPTLSIDYLARLNEMTRPAAAAGENAWPDYEKAIELYVAAEEVDEGEVQADKERLSRIVGRTVGKEKYVPYGELESQDQAAIIEWIDRNKEAWAHYDEGSRKAYCYREYTVGDEESHPMLLTVLLPQLSEICDMARLGVWRSEKQTHEGKDEEAFETCLTLIRVGLHWYHNKGTLIEQLVGQAIVRLGLAQMVVLVAKDELSSEEMARVQQELAAIFKAGFPYMTVRYEQLMFEDMVQHSFTDGGPGGGHIIPKMYFELTGDLGGGDEELAYLGAGVVQAGRNKTLAAGNKLYDHMEKIFKMSPYQLHSGDIKSVEELLSSYSKWRYSFVWVIMPAIGRVAEIRYQGKALYDAVLTILAVKRWELDKGALPESLEQLKEAGYLKELPDDPYSEGLLTYARGDGDFVLYSLADDFDDDGGKQNPENAWGREEEGGDRVFWPVQ